jgi:hypothetical protein
VTTKVKGQGFLPINVTKDKTLNMSEPSSFAHFTEISSKMKYMMLDTAGEIKNFSIKETHLYSFSNPILHFLKTTLFRQMNLIVFLL